MQDEDGVKGGYGTEGKQETHREGNSSGEHSRSHSRSPPQTSRRESSEEFEHQDDVSSLSSSHPLSRSPPASRHSSPSRTRSRSHSRSSLADRTANLILSDVLHDPPSNSKDITEKVLSEVTKRRARQQRKYHSKKGAQRVGGRPKGSKAKMDGRIKLDKGGVWD